MDALCKCGGTMQLQICQLRLAYEKPVIVNHVPVVHCMKCGRSEVFAAVKETLYHVLAPSNRSTADAVLAFDQFSECANYLVQLNGEPIQMRAWIDQLCNRMDDLLDLLGVAMSMSDDAWSEDIQRRLRELHLTIQTTHHYC